MSLALYPSRVRSNELLGREPPERVLVDTYSALDFALGHFDLATARVIILLANSLGPIARLELNVCVGIHEALTLALCAVCAALTAI
jgi:hypothetical protein